MRGEGVKIAQNSVHVVCTRPHLQIFIECGPLLKCSLTALPVLRCGPTARTISHSTEWDLVESIYFNFCNTKNQKKIPLHFQLFKLIVYIFVNLTTLNTQSTLVPNFSNWKTCCLCCFCWVCNRKNISYEAMRG